MATMSDEPLAPQTAALISVVMGMFDREVAQVQALADAQGEA